MTVFGLDLLKGKACTDLRGRRCVLELAPAAVWLLQAAPFLPPSKVTNVKPCILPSGVKERINPVISDLGDQGIINPTQTPLLPVCVSLTGSGSWPLATSIWIQTQAPGPFNAAVLNTAEFGYPGTRSPCSGNYQYERCIFYSPSARIRQGTVCIYMGRRAVYPYSTSPWILAFSHPCSLRSSSRIGPNCPRRLGQDYQYIDDVLSGCPEVEAVDQTEVKIIIHLESLGLHILTEKAHLPSSGKILRHLV